MININRAIGLTTVATVASLAACSPKPADEQASSSQNQTPKQGQTMTSIIPAKADAPIAERRDYTVKSPQGDRPDPYYWLRDDKREDADMLAYLNAENAYTKRVLAPVADLQEALFKEITGRLKQDDASPPEFSNGYWYYSRFEPGKDYAIHARRKGNMDAPEELLIDENVRAEGHDFYALGETAVSPDNRYLAVAEDTVGRRQYVARVYDLQTQKWLDDEITNINANLVWTNDSASLLYVEKDAETLLGKRVRQHTLGGTDDPLIYEEQDDSFYMGIGRSKTDEYLFIGLYATDTSEILVADANADTLAFRPVLPRQDGHEYGVDHLRAGTLPGDDGDQSGGRFLIRSNWSGSADSGKAPNFQLFTVPVADSADRSKWDVLIAHDPAVLIEGTEAYADYLAINERSGGLRKIRLHNWKTGKQRYIESDQPAYAAEIEGSDEYDWPLLRYSLDTLTDPSTTIDINMATGEKTVVKVDPVEGEFDASLYASEYIRAAARDGTQVPVSIVYRKDLRAQGQNPLMVYGYGSYGYSMDPYHSVSRLSLLDRGFVFAVAHVRGGEELGRAWYDAGRLEAKQNTFSDFIDVTKHLVKTGYGHPDRVFAAGGSAGGLLMGAVANQAPELYRGMIADVPFVDVVTTMLDESIPLTTNEFDEWGNPKFQPFYDVMLAYSPYDNVAAQDYPALLILGGLWDSQVQYWEPAKWAARLRHTATSGGPGEPPILLAMNMDAGHGGQSGRFRRYREVAMEYAFLLGLLGIDDPETVAVKPAAAP